MISTSSEYLNHRHEFNTITEEKVREIIREEIEKFSNEISDYFANNINKK